VASVFAVDANRRGGQTRGSAPTRTPKRASWASWRWCSWWI